MVYHICKTLEYHYILIRLLLQRGYTIVDNRSPLCHSLVKNRLHYNTRSELNPRFTTYVQTGKCMLFKHVKILTEDCIIENTCIIIILTVVIIIQYNSILMCLYMCMFLVILKDESTSGLILILFWSLLSHLLYFDIQITVIDLSQNLTPF